jgi:uncharacterized protein YceK
MKLILALTVVAIASGCSSLPMQKAENVPAPVVAASSTSCDYDKMRAIDRSANARVYMYVAWLHCPTLGERDKS